MCSCNIGYTKNTINEFKSYQNNLAAYLKADGTLLNNITNDINLFVMQNLTLPPMVETN